MLTLRYKRAESSPNSLQSLLGFVACCDGGGGGMKLFWKISVKISFGNRYFYYRAMWLQLTVLYSKLAQAVNLDTCIQ
jgi:hypothetical protein